MSPIPTLIIATDEGRRRWLSDFVAHEKSLCAAGMVDSLHRAIGALHRAAVRVVILDDEHPQVKVIRAELRAWDDQLPVIRVSFASCRPMDLSVIALTDPASTPVTGSAALRIVEAIERRLAEREAAYESGLRRLVPAPRTQSHVQMVAIGSSTGGPQALTALLTRLDADFPVPIVVAQHLPPQFVDSLATQLDRRAAVTVTMARDGGEPRPGHVYLAPGDRHLRVRREAGVVRLALDDGPAINCCRPSVDALFESLAVAYSARCLGVVLTGMGNDGVQGARCLRQAQASVLVQDEATSAAWGMPRAVVEASFANEIVALTDLALAIERHCGVARSQRLSS